MKGGARGAGCVEQCMEQCMDLVSNKLEKTRRCPTDGRQTGHSRHVRGWGRMLLPAIQRNMVHNADCTRDSANHGVIYIEFGLAEHRSGVNERRFLSSFLLSRGAAGKEPMLLELPDFFSFLCLLLAPET